MLREIDLGRSNVWVLSKKKKRFSFKIIKDFNQINK
jgi:hypothetical protein